MRRPSRKMTADLVKMIKGLLATNQYHQHQIAAIVEVNQGRISEVRSGKWDWLLHIEDRQKNLPLF